VAQQLAHSTSLVVDNANI